jgi:hypothetical protein
MRRRYAPVPVRDATTISVSGSWASGVVPATVIVAFAHGCSAAQEGQLLREPCGDVPLLGGCVAVALHQTAFLLVQIALHPDRRVGPRVQRPADHAGAFDPHDVEVGGHRDRPWPSALDPGRWTELHRVAPVQGPQDVLDQEVGPVEERLVPGHVVGVHDS